MDFILKSLFQLYRLNFEFLLWGGFSMFLSFMYFLQTLVVIGNPSTFNFSILLGWVWIILPVLNFTTVMVHHRSYPLLLRGCNDHSCFLLCQWALSPNRQRVFREWDTESLVRGPVDRISLLSNVIVFLDLCLQVSSR